MANRLHPLFAEILRGFGMAETPPAAVECPSCGAEYPDTEPHWCCGVLCQAVFRCWTPECDNPVPSDGDTCQECSAERSEAYRAWLAELPNRMPDATTEAYEPRSHA